MQRPQAKPRVPAHTPTQHGAGALGPCAGILGGWAGSPLSCATGEQAVSPGGGHSLGLPPRAVEPLEEGCRIQPLKAPGAAGDQGVGVEQEQGPWGGRRDGQGSWWCLARGEGGP